MSLVIGDERSAGLERIERDAFLDKWRAVDPETAAPLGVAHSERAGMALLAMGSLDFGLFNRALGLGCDGPVSDDDLAEAAAWLRAHSTPAWRIDLLGTELKDGLDAHANRLGLAYKRVGTAKMYRGAGPPSPTEEATGLDVRAVARRDMRACASLCAAGFGLPSETVEALLTPLVDRPRWHSYAAYRDDIPVAFGLMFIDGAWAWLGWGATLPAHRGRGAQSALLRRRVADGLASGVEHFSVSCVTPSDADRSTFASYRNIIRAGFREAHRYHLYGPALDPRP